MLGRLFINGRAKRWPGVLAQSHVTLDATNPIRGTCRLQRRVCVKCAKRFLLRLDDGAQRKKKTSSKSGLNAIWPADSSFPLSKRTPPRTSKLFLIHSIRLVALRRHIGQWVIKIKRRPRRTAVKVNLETSRSLAVDSSKKTTNCYDPTNSSSSLTRNSTVVRC